MGASLKPRIVISAVNFSEAGPLSVFHDALNVLAKDFSHHYEIVALVHDRALFQQAPVTFLEFPKIKSSWLRRIWFEYYSCRSLSRQLNAALWLALHDMTPNVEAEIRAVYCHNASAFDRLRPSHLLRDRKHAAFVLLYRYLYRINLLKNDFVIVQQQWLRREFRRLFGHQRIVVAHPSVSALAIPPRSTSADGICRFFYPALPRPFKNFEVLLAAVRQLHQQAVGGFSLALTIDGSENRYAAQLRASASDLPEIQWLGRLSRAEVLSIYANTDCLLFPSTLETWGMPISEFKQTDRPILAADLPYAHETVGSYNAARFFPPHDAATLADLMQQLIHGKLHFEPVTEPDPAPPFAPDWKSLFELLLSHKQSERPETDAIAQLF